MKRAAWLFAGAGILAAPALAADLTGTWSIQGPIDPVCTLTQQGNALSGNCSGPAAQGSVTGTVDGDTVRWTFSRTGRGGGAMAPVDFSGAVSGDNLTGTLSIGGRGGAFTARRIQGAPNLAGSAPGAKPPPTISPINPALNSIPPRSVFDVDVDRGATHQQSHLVCPAAVAGFPRIGTTLFDRWGFDVGCTYRNAAGSTITLYVYRALGRGSMDEDFNGAQGSVPQVTPGAQPRGQTGIHPPGPDWRGAGFTLPNGALTEIHIAPLSDWRLKYRVTYMPAEAGAAGAAITELSGIVARTAGPHLARCAASPPPPRTGQRNRDTDVLQALAAATAFEAANSVVASKPDMNWCAEAGFNAGSRDFLYWRNADAGTAGAVDRITPINEGPRAFVVRAPAKVVAEVMKEMGVRSAADPETVYGLVLDGADQMSIVAIFSGRPSPQEIAPLALAERYPVYGTVPKQPGGRIQLYKPY
jgi:hypothetical protein